MFLCDIVGINAVKNFCCDENFRQYSILLKNLVSSSGWNEDRPYYVYVSFDIAGEQ